MATPDAQKLQQLQNMAHKLRLHSIESTNASASGHPTSCSSIAEIMSVLFFHVMKYKLSQPRDPASDRLILSKGHAAPILYAAWAEAGLFPVRDLLNLRKIDSDLEGHPTPRLNFVDVATGSLGQGLSIACGMAYVGKYFDKSDYRTYCIVGDGESAEGNILEALNFASYYKLNNLCTIFDVNRLGQSQPTMLQHNIEKYRLHMDSIGFHTIIVDGHNVAELCKAFAEAATVTDCPTAIIAKTLKGKYFVDIEDKDGWHGKIIGDKSKPTIDRIRSLIKNSTAKLSVTEPTASVPTVRLDNIRLSSAPDYKIPQQVPTRVAYGTALVKLVSTNRRIVALDGDTKNSTYSDRVIKSYPQNHIECFIAEQNMVGVAIGVACRDRMVSFASTFGAFLTRAFDQIRMAAISGSNANFVGSHAGVSIGEDGPSQMGLEDIAMFRLVAGSTVFYPSDAVATERAVELAANTKGICFIRTTRAATPIIYDNDAKFAIGKASILRKSDTDKLLVIAAGITLIEAIEAHDILKEKHQVNIRILDPFTIKPIDRELIVTEAKQCCKQIITVEDHYYEGGLGEAVLAAVADELIQVKLMAVGSIPRSGKPKELIEMFGISAKTIIENVLKFV